MKVKNKIKDAEGIQRKSAFARSEAELRYSALFEQSPYGILLIDTEGKILDFNEIAHRDLGYTREEFADITIADIDLVESSVDVKARISRILEKGSAEFETRHRTKQGEIRDVHVITKAFVSSGQTLLQSIWRDITERKKTEKELNLFKNLIYKSNDAIMITEPETGRFLIVNDKACVDLGYDRNQLLTMRTLDIEAIFPDQAAWDAHVSELKSKGSLVLEGMNRHRDGTLFPVEVSVTYMTFGETDYMVAVVRDITKRKQADAALREREKQLAESQRIAHIGSWEHNLTTGQAFWSDELLRLLGFDPETDPADFNIFFEMVHPDDRAALKKAIDETVRDGNHFSIDYRFNLRDGRTRVLHAQAELIHDDTGTQTILSGTAQDITERKEAEEKIHQSEAFIRNILDTVDEGFIVIDRDFRILTANKAYCSQVGKPCASVIGRHCYEISHKTLRPCHEEGEECAVLHVFETGEPHVALHKHPDAKGSLLYVETKAFPIKDSTGAVTSVIETVNNITEKHLLEEEQLKTQKLEAIGLLAGGIAHDFNNLLQGVFGYISMAKITLEQKEHSLTMLEQAEKALHMSVNLTTQLLTFSKGGTPAKKKIQLQSLIENSVRFALSGSSVDFKIKFDDDLYAVDADEGQIGQVIQNIVLNADQAMPLGGTMTITAKNVCAPDKGLPPHLAEGNYVEISVKDNGGGVPEQHITRLFDPYFTTKEKGSGLGLATSYSIIKNHGGLIDVKSQLGKGSNFLVYLPAVDTGEEGFMTIPETAYADRKGRVLVMDDEELIRNIVGIMLRALGHDTEFAENGEEAIAKYREALSSGRRFDIVILDLTVRGGMGGAEVIRELLALDPEVKAIVSSGYSDSATIAEYESRGFSACLAKPYEVDALRNILNRLLK